MSSTLKKIAVFGGAFVLVVFSIFVFNQTIQIIQSARTVNPVFGIGVA
jgi:hypothetical protein